MEFPTLVYKDKGPFQRPGGTFNYKPVADADGFDAAVADGWHASLEQAVAPKLEAKATEPANDNAPPTRAELEAKATELGLKFDGRTGDKTLSERIEAALAGA